MMREFDIITTCHHWRQGERLNMFWSIVVKKNPCQELSKLFILQIKMSTYIAHSIPINIAFFIMNNIN